MNTNSTLRNIILASGFAGLLTLTGCNTKSDYIISKNISKKEKIEHIALAVSECYHSSTTGFIWYNGMSNDYTYYLSDGSDRPLTYYNIASKKINYNHKTFSVIKVTPDSLIMNYIK